MSIDLDRVYQLDSRYALSLSSAIRDRETLPSDLNDALNVLGEKVAEAIVERFYLVDETIVTPMNVSYNTQVLRVPKTVIITTREDLGHFAVGLRRVLRNCDTEWMDFEGRRGFDALNSPVRETSFSARQNQPVDSLIIAKSTLATGCTAVSLTKNALVHYLPDRLIIASIFYTLAGLAMLRDAFPNAHIFVVGNSDDITDDGLLTPGIGVLAERTGGTP